MYAQLVGTGMQRVLSHAELSDEERRFWERIDAGIKIEPKDWMPPAYRKTLIRQILPDVCGRSRTFADGKYP